MFRDRFLTRHFPFFPCRKIALLGSKAFSRKETGGGKRTRGYLTNRHMQTLITENHTLALGSRISPAQLTLIPSVKQCSLALQRGIREGRFGKPATIRPYSHEGNQVTQTLSHGSCQPDLLSWLFYWRQLCFFKGSKKPHLYAYFSIYDVECKTLSHSTSNTVWCHDCLYNPPVCINKDSVCLLSW